MPFNIPFGWGNWPLGNWGTGPKDDATGALWRCTIIAPTVGNIEEIIDTARALNMRVFANLSASRNFWTNPTVIDGVTYLIFDWDKYEAQVRRWLSTADGGLVSAAVAAKIAAAFADGTFIAYTVDEPYLNAVFHGSIPKSVQNDMGLLYKSLWPGTLTAQRASYDKMNPAPAGGWTGLDYGWSQYDRAAQLTGLTRAAWFAREKAGLAALDLGMVPALNWVDGGDGRLWDYLNTGSSSGRIVAANGAPRWACAPDEIKETADIVWDDPDAIAFTGYIYPGSTLGTDEARFADLLLRDDYVSANDYALGRFAARPTSNGLRTPKGTVAPPPVGTGVEVDHFASVPVTTRVSTTSGAYVDVPGAIIPADSLTPGKKYLLVASATIDLGSTSAEGYVRALSGATLLRRSESAFSVNATTSKLAYFWFTVLTAVAGEDIKLQYRTSDGVAAIGANFCQLFAMNLSDDLADGTDYRFAESTASTALTSSYQDGASITLTPATGGEDWLILTAAHYATPSLSQSVVSGLRRSGEAVETDPEVQMEGEDALDLYRLSTAKVVTLGAVSNTFAEQSKHTGGGGPRDGSAVFALRLNRFAAHGASYSNTAVDLSGSAYGTAAATASITPTVDGDVWVLGSLGWVANSITAMRARLQVDGSDSPSGQTTASSLFHQALDATDVAPVLLSSVTELIAAPHTVELDASANSAGTGRAARGRLVMGVTMRLAGGAATGTFRHRKTSFTSKLGTKTGARKAA